MQQLPKPTLLVINGPTGIGKTSAAIAVAKALNTVILSADSRQCYKELKIGVARPSDKELQEVPHYFIASHSIHEDITAAYYEQYALNLLTTIFKKYPVVVMTGGTGLYIKAVAEGLDEIPSVPEHIHNQIIEDYQKKGMQWLRESIEKRDPEFAIHGEMKNPQRMMRALEVAEATGKSILSYHSQDKKNRFFRVIQIALNMDRPLLYERIDTRVLDMMNAGLADEVKQLISYKHLNALQTVGYKELFDYYDGKQSLDRAVKLIQQHTRRYAKRQLTWLKKQDGIQWFDITKQNNVAEQIIAYFAANIVN